MNSYQIEFITGKVLGQQKHVETHVYSQGGGGHVGPNGGHVKAPEVKSYNTTRHDIFLSLENGQEVSVSFPFNDIIIRDGHIITLVSAFRNAAKNGFYIRLLNHNTDIIYNVTTEAILNSLTSEEPDSKPLKFGCLASLIVFIVAWALQSTFFAFQGTLTSFTAIAVAITVLGFVNYNDSRKRLMNSAKKDLDTAVDQALARLSSGNELPPVNN